MALWYDEVTDDAARFGLKVERVLFMGRSGNQKVAVVETTSCGRALLIDDRWVCTERDGNVRHELMAHIPLALARRAQRVLVLGGCDGGTAREVLRHRDVGHVDLVERDALGLEVSKRLLGTGGAAWDDPRLHVHVADPVAWLNDARHAPYDVILLDVTPSATTAPLFARDSLTACRARLDQGGVFMVYAESPATRRELHLAILDGVAAVFGHAFPCYAPASGSPAGTSSWAVAIKRRDADPLDLDEVRAARVEQHSRYYNRAIHRAAFAVPNDIKLALAAKAK